MDATRHSVVCHLSEGHAVHHARAVGVRASFRRLVALAVEVVVREDGLGQPPQGGAALLLDGHPLRRRVLHLRDDKWRRWGHPAAPAAVRVSDAHATLSNVRGCNLRAAFVTDPQASTPSSATRS
eukprot:9468700-Pyramimonas_sp.AAC.1